MPPKKPGVRLAKYEKLIHRFFEVFILATFIRKVHGSHITAKHDLSTPAGARRRFLKNLAFLCDNDKGGSSTTGICVEDRHDCYVVWVASNKGASSEVVAFLKSILDSLRTASSGQKQIHEGYLLQVAAKFARTRVFKEWKILVRSAIQALAVLEKEGDQDTGFITWLKQFQLRRGQSPVSICQLAYDIRKAEQIHTIELLHNPSDSFLTDSFKHLKWVAHIIGRLAARVRAVKHLIDDAARLEHDIANPWTVEAVPLPESTPVPEADRNSKLRGILNRMMDAGDPEYDRLLTCLVKLDRACSLMAGVLSKHADGDNPLKPFVHCEVQLVDHFHDYELVFWKDDPYVACSKPACLLCRLYMEHHPILFVETDSHNKIPTNWGPAFLRGGVDDPRFRSQRNILTAMIKDVRGPVLKQIGTISRSRTFHADSLDQVTQPEDDPFHHLDTDSAFLTEPEDGVLDLDLDEGAATWPEEHSEVHDVALMAHDNMSDSDSDGGASL